ncbi:hypothetical protein Nepgr_012570 [Nepenthes gracilis]|uniref:U3 small nucleolar RNA-associated protein 10 N-terminal domain-containing protein n=1 Tax=Nepenthes gracilis TaxID=150966 RepID=A0AAD3SHI6_NEPGR|nr:hypothetical protein Nepgr_012570 [Nepenthes gracilis]
MTSSSIALQLQAIKSIVKGATEPLTRPYTRPSILFDPKEAADIDIETIHNIAYSGVEVLENVDERFRHHKNELFGHRSREFDRELISREENNRVNASINSYLRLLSGHLHLPSASKTLEYLIRRYKIHVYNIEELILCALPYHDTHAFVRIVQLIDLGNSRWRFLGGVKATGALLPRKVIVQQCMRDMGVLEVLCNYATPTKKYQPSMPVITFCTAVVVEVFGSLSTVGSDAVKRILPFVVSGLQSGTKGISDYKAGALMIAGLLANRVALSPKLVKSFVRSIAELARADAKESSDLQCSQMSIIALINIVQLQSVETLPKKAVDILKEIRDLSGILSGLIRKFNIDGFLTVLLVSLVDYSNSDSLCKLAVISIVESVPVGGLVHHIVPRLLFSCLRLSQNSNASESSESGNWAKQILGVIHEKYPHELRSSFHKFVEDKKVQSKGESWVFDTLCRMLDGNIHATSEISDSRIWFALEHSKAEIRRAALNSFDTSTILNSRVVNPQRLVSIQDVVLRRLCDDDLSVVQAALSLDRLSDLISSPLLFEAFKNVLLRCTRVLLSDASNDFSLASDIAISCLRHAVSFVQNWNDFVEELATMVFPLLLVLPKTKRLNLKAQELSQEIKWPFYKNLVSVHGAEKKPTQAWLSSVNMTVVSSLADVFMANAQEYIHWLTNCCSSSEISRTLLFLILLHSLMEKNVCWLPAMYDACFAFLKKEWEALKNGGELLSGGEFNISILEGGCLQLLDQLHVTNLKELNAKVLVCILWRLLKAYIIAMPGNASLDDNDEWIRNLRDLFVLFSECHLKHVFKEHLHYLLLNCRLSPILFLLKFITKEGVSSAVQVQSLNSLTLLSSSSDENFALHLLAEFPSILVPLSSEIQDVRTAALNYVEGLLTLCSRVKGAGRKNGNIEPWSPFIDELLSMVVQQKKLILSDREFLPSLLTSILSASYQSLLLSNNARQRFEKSTRENILRFILLTAVKLPSYAQLKILSLVKEVGDAILRIKDMSSLLSELLQRRRAFSYGSERPCPKLSKIDVDILCLLIEICCMPTSSDILDVERYILLALRIEDMKSDDPAILWPCLTVLRKLNDRLYGSLRAGTQEKLLQELVLLHCNDNLDIQNAATDALLRINISCSSFSALIDYALGFEVPQMTLPIERRNL